MTTAHKRILLIAAIDVGVLVVGVFGATWGERKGFLAFAAGAIALVTFFGSLAIEAPESGTSPTEDGPIRRAIASSIVMMYLVLVATFAFFEPQPPLDGLLLNFTTTIGVVIAFYFGSSAYLEARRYAATKEKDRERETAREYGN